MKIKNENINLQTLVKIWLIVSAGCLFIFHIYILGRYTVAFYDVGTDGKDQYIMWYNGIVNSLRDGNFSTWDFRNGFGINTMGHNLTDPFLIPVFVLGYIFGPEHITYYMVWVEIVRILISATVCYWFLSEFSYEEDAKLVATIIYAFNAYMMVWGQHYALGSALVYFPIILMCIERVLKRKRFGTGLCLICCFTLMSTFYQGYMCMLAGGFYVCVRLLMMEYPSIKEKTRVFLLCAGSMILGVLMSAFRFFPSAAAQVGSSARLESQTSLVKRLFMPGVWSAEICKTILYRLFSSCIQGNGNEIYVGQKNFYEDPELFFSTLFIIILLQYLVMIPKFKESRKSKIWQYLAVFMCTASVIFTNITTWFNGLYKPFFRHTFILMPIFAILTAKMLDYIFREKKLNLPMLVIAALGITAVYYKAYHILPEQQFQNNAMLLWMTGMAMSVILYLYCYGKRTERSNMILLLIIAVTVNICSDSFLCYNDRVALSKDHPEYYAETYHSDVDAALNWIEANDDTFYRVEKDYFTSSSCFDSLAQDYRGISAYNANQNANIKEFTEKLWPQLNHEKDIYHIQFQNALWDSTMAALTDVKYILTKSPAMNVEGYHLIHQEGEIYIFRNEKTDSLGKFYSKTMTQEQYEERAETLNTPQLLKEVLLVSEEDSYNLKDSEIGTYEKTEISDILSNKDVLETMYETRRDANGDYLPLVVEMQLNPEVLQSLSDMIFQFKIDAEKRTIVQVTLDDGEQSYRHFFVQNWSTPRDIHIEVGSQVKNIRLEIENPNGYAKLGSFSFYGTQESLCFSEGAVITVAAPQKDSLLTGTVSASEDGYVCLAIPYEKGWDVYLDGVKQELITGDYGFLAFEVKAGEYRMEIRFTAPLLKEGTLVSVLSLLVFLTILIMEKRRDKGVIK